jgi:hypothetical protein
MRCDQREEPREREREERGAHILSFACFMHLDVYFICFIWMLHVFHPDVILYVFHHNVAYVAMAIHVC